ncbi:MAG: Gldg family protein [Alphaproteobacteria bacterium]|nr:Gldg family protein [Alphaproteobacteria bacterium]
MTASPTQQPASRTTTTADAVRLWLADAVTIAKHESRLLFYAPLTLIFQVWFLLALAISIFLVAEFYSTDLANFELQWTFLPWVALVMAPALAMRAFAESPGDRGLELTLSLPVSSTAVVAGKWVAGTLAQLLTLAMTLPFILTVGYLGDPDWGIAASGYLGAALLLAVFYAVAILAASFTKDHVAAYVTGLASLTIMLLLGWDTAARVLGASPAGHFISSLSTISPKYWLARMAEGRIELAALATMLLAIVLALAAAAAMIERRRRSGQADLHTWVIGLLFGIAAVILLAGTARLPWSFDVTAAQEFTLHEETRAVAAAAPEALKIDFYYSRDESSIPARIRQHAQRVRNLLREIAGHADGRIEIVEHPTSEDTEAEETAIAAGVRRIPMSSGDSFILGAVFRHADRQGVIAYFDEERGELLEYDLALAIDTLGRNKTYRIGVLSPLLRATNAQTPREGMAMLEDVKRNYDIAVVPYFADELPEGLDALIVIDARILKRSMLYSIDQHLMSGRGLIVMFDPYPRFNRANMGVNPEPGDAINDITDLLAKYGVEFRGTDVVGDANLGALVTSSDGRQLSYPFWLRTRRSALSRSHPVTASLNELLFSEAGSVALTAGGDGAVALVETTPEHTGVLPRETFKDADSEKLAADFKPAGGSRTIAAALAGPFQSPFDGPLPAAAETGEDTAGNAPAPEQTPPPRSADEPAGTPKTRSAPASRPHIAGIPSASLFAVADADWLFDPMALQTVTVGDRTMTRPLNDNAAFLINMVEYATGNPRLIGIRSRKALRRPFTRVAAMLKDAQDRYRAEEADFVQRIAGVETAIAKVIEATGATSVDQLPDTLLEEIQGLRTKLLPFRRELRRIRRSMREDVEALGLRVTLFNLFGGPLLAVAFAALLFNLRRKKLSADPADH